MAGNNIDVEAKDRMLRIEVRNMIAVDGKAKDVLEIQPLQFKLDVPLALSGDGTQEKLKKDALARMEKNVKDIVAKAQGLVNDEIKNLGEGIRKERGKDDKGDKSAYRNAVKQVESAVARLEDIVDGLPPSAREAVKKVIKGKEFEGIFPKQKLTSVGSWGFRDRKGICVRPGTFRNVTKDDHADADRDLWEALKNAKSSPHGFVFVDGSKAGLVVRKSITTDDKKLAKEQSNGGKVWTGRVTKEGDVYRFDLDKDCNESTEGALARKISALVQKRCNRKVKVKVSDDDQDVDDDGPQAKDGQAASAKKP
jgi:hypothetical protein